MATSEFKRHRIWLAEHAQPRSGQTLPHFNSAYLQQCQAAAKLACDAGAALPSHTGILGDVKQLEQILHLPAAAMQGARN